jgi:hypothetical protein
VHSEEILYYTDDAGDTFLRNVGSYNRQHGITSERAALFTVRDVSGTVI